MVQGTGRSEEKAADASRGRALPVKAGAEDKERSDPPQRYSGRALDFAWRRVVG
jgi:hypothetical protein